MQPSSPRLAAECRSMRLWHVHLSLLCRSMRLWHARLSMFLLRIVSLIHTSTCAATGKRSYKHLVGADGSIKSVVRKGDAVIDAATLGPQKGKRMLVATGRHAGVKCVVRDLDADGREGVLLCSRSAKYDCSIALHCEALPCATRHPSYLHSRGGLHLCATAHCESHAQHALSAQHAYAN